MKRTLWMTAVALAAAGVWLAARLMAQPVGDPMMESFRMVEVASVADAMEQLYGQKAYMSHEMRPLNTAKFAGPAITVLMKKEEHKEGSKASEGMLDAIDNAKPGSVYVMVLEDGGDYAGIGGLFHYISEVRASRPLVGLARGDRTPSGILHTGHAFWRRENRRVMLSDSRGRRSP